jgi:hypothetical protein
VPKRIAIASLVAIAVVAVGLAMSEVGGQPVAVDSLKPSPTIWPSADLSLRAPQGWSRITRAESGAEPAVVLTLDWTASAEASGDASPQTLAMADITGLEVDVPCYSDAVCVIFDIARAPEQPPRDPASEWVAYGLVVDNDGDAAGDAMIGVDNALAGKRAGPRSWQVDLSSGALLYESTGYGAAFANGFVPWFVEHGGSENRGSVNLPRSLAGPIRMTRTSDERGTRFYLFAAVIRRSEIVAVDFTPDVGWLEAVRYGE